MVPPPESTGDEFPDFEHMTFEEQMAWLESLAKRQGAKQEELTTAADMDIAEVPEGTVIDEPGYVPFADSRAAREAQRAKLEPEVKKEIPPEPEAPVEEVIEAPVEVAPWEISLTDEAEAEEMVDPMRWLDDLAAHPGQGEVGLDFGLDDVELLDTSEEFNAVLLDNIPESAEIEFDFGFEPESEYEANLEPQSEPVVEWQDFLPPDFTAEAESELAPTAEDDLLGGIDPMLWLESLAARQGARAEELTTSANLEIPEVPDDAVIDEPGYVPYDVITEGRKPVAEPRYEQRAPEEAMPLWEEVPSEIEEPEVTFGQDELVGAADTMDWLESLSRPQRALPEEFELDALAEEPEPVDYSPNILPPEFEASDEPLSWLEALAAIPDEDTSDVLAFDTAMFEEQPEAAPQELAEAAAVWSDDILAGMTDEEIAVAQAQGRLTGEQELAWLQRQALKLAEARQAEEEFAGDVEMAPAEPGELPPWLQEMRETGFVSSDKPPALVEDELPLPEVVDVPDWFGEPAPESVFNVEELSIDTDVDSLWADIPSEIEHPLVAEEVSESELDAFLKGDFVLEQSDQLADALDAEYERKLVGDESEPEWYTEAVAQGTEEAPLETLEPVATEAAVEPVLEEAVPMEMPDWLRETTEEPTPAAEVTMPAWLMEDIEETSPEVDIPAVPDWLSEEVEMPGEPEVVTPEWTVEEAPEVPAAAAWLPEPAPEMPSLQEVRSPEPPVVVPVKATALPEGELFVQYRERLEQDPSDYATRLALARALHTNNELGSSMDQYDVLIDAMQLLQDVSDDLRGLLEENPDDPRLRRLMGDSYMRRGMLQQALEAYRSALDRL